MVSVILKNFGVKFILDKERERTLKSFLLHPFKRYYKKEFWALQHVDLELKNGDILGITGPNGSGKSTLLKAINKIYDADEGTIEVEGKSALLAIGAGFQEELTGLENIYLNGSVFGFSKKKIDCILGDLLNFADLGEFIHQPIRTYSSGMISRLGFSIAVNLNPDILLIDEVFAVGDKDFKEKSQQKIESILKDKNKIVLLVSHDQDLIKKICNKTIFIEKGVVKSKSF